MSKMRLVLQLVCFKHDLSPFVYVLGSCHPDWLQIWGIREFQALRSAENVLCFSTPLQFNSSASSVFQLLVQTLNRQPWQLLFW